MPFVLSECDKPLKRHLRHVGTELADLAECTEAGLPFGVTGEEMEGLDGDDVPFAEDDVRKGGF